MKADADSRRDHRESPGKFEEVDIDLDESRQGGRRVKMAATGLRHSDKRPVIEVVRFGVPGVQGSRPHPRRCRRLVPVSTATSALMLQADRRVLLVTRRRDLSDG
jgi:hypothetical protein